MTKSNTKSTAKAKVAFNKNNSNTKATIKKTSSNKSKNIPRTQQTRRNSVRNTASSSKSQNQKKVQQIVEDESDLDDSIDESESESEDNDYQKSTYSRTTPDHYEAMINWLEIPENSALVTGDAANGKPVGGKALKKSDGIRSLMKYVNIKVNEPNGLKPWDSKSTDGRLRSYKKKYTNEKNAMNRTGYGLKERHLKAGLETIDERKNYECPFYNRMDALFAKKHNVNPVVVKEFGRMAATLAPTEELNNEESTEERIANPEPRDSDDGMQPSDVDEIYGDMLTDEGNSADNGDTIQGPAPAPAQVFNEAADDNDNDDGDEAAQRTKKRYFAGTFARTEEVRMALEEKRLELDKEREMREQMKFDLEEKRFKFEKEERTLHIHLDQRKTDDAYHLKKLELKTNFVRDLLLQGKDPKEIQEILNMFFNKEYDFGDN